MSGHGSERVEEVIILAEHEARSDNCRFGENFSDRELALGSRPVGFGRSIPTRAQCRYVDLPGHALSLRGQRHAPSGLTWSTR
jgi:hypothetical protein